MKNRLPKWSVVAAAVLALAAGGSALAANSNYWIGATDLSFNQDTNWSLGHRPTTTECAFFTNAVSQQITFNASVDSGSLQIYDSPVVFDLNGYRWTTISENLTPSIAITAAAPVTVHFSSTSQTNVSGGNYVRIGNTDYHTGTAALRGPVTLKVDDDLGYPVWVDWLQGNGRIDSVVLVIVEGTNTVFRYTGQYAGIARLGGTVLVSNRAEFATLGLWTFGYRETFTAKVVNASTFRTPKQDGVVGGWLGKADILLQESAWVAEGGHIRVGVEGSGSVILSNSTFTGQRMTLGDGTASGRLDLLAGSSATFSTQLLVSASGTLVLNSGTISLGGGTTPGVLTNKGLLRAAGTIHGASGSGKATVRNEKFLYVGNSNSIGTLTLSNADLVLAASSTNWFEFDPSVAGSGDAINVTAGTATIGGTVAVTNTPGFTPKRGSGLKWDFVQADSIVYTASDNITSLMSAYGLTAGSDYAFGVVSSGGGQALRLRIFGSSGTVIIVQ